MTAMIEYANGILRAYHGEYGLRKLPIRIDRLKPFFEERGHADIIELRQAEFPARNFLARITRKRVRSAVYADMSDHATIHFADKLNVCWRRFVICKEMYHCMIDHTDETRVTTTEDMNRLLEMFVVDTRPVAGEFGPLESEETAVLLALETLLPVEYREMYMPYVNNHHVTLEQIADHTRVPLHFVKIAFQSGYHANAAARRGRLLKL